MSIRGLLPLSVDNTPHWAGRKFAAVGVVVAVGLPWGLAELPLVVRCVLIGVVAVVAAAAWLVAVFQGRRSDGCHCVGARFAACMGMSAVASAWISVLSFSAQISMVPTPLIYGVIGAILILILWLTEWACCLGCRQGIGTRAGPWLCVALLVSCVLAQPGRRFHGGQNSLVVREASEGIKTVADAVQVVSRRITPRRSPFTDTAADTLARGAAQCGGMANVLDKVLKAAGFKSRIVHLENDRLIHTLVEYFDAKKQSWCLLDPQHAIFGEAGGGLSGWDVVMKESSTKVPEVWQGYTELYIYQPRGGYHRVTEKNWHMYYPHTDGE